MSQVPDEPTLDLPDPHPAAPPGSWAHRIKEAMEARLPAWVRALLADLEERQSGTFAAPTGQGGRLQVDAVDVTPAQVGAQPAGDYQPAGEYAPAAHQHPRADISDATALGRTLMALADATAGRTALGITVDATVGTRVLVAGQMVYGSVSRLLRTADLINGWRTYNPAFPADPDSGAPIRLSREGNSVTLTIPQLSLWGADATDDRFLVLPTGFRTDITGNYGTVGFVRGAAGAIEAISKDFNHLATVGRGKVSGILRWRTNDPWPTTLPGNPA